MREGAKCVTNGNVKEKKKTESHKALLNLKEIVFKVESSSKKQKYLKNSSSENLPPSIQAHYRYKVRNPQPAESKKDTFFDN